MPLNCLLEFDLIYIFNFEEMSMIYHVYVSNDFLIDVFIAVAAMDTNAEILI